MNSARNRLLIVDDEPALRYTLIQIFRAEGFEIQSAEDGFTALHEIREAVPDILLCDLNMPGMSGFELLAIVRRRFPRIHVIAMSGGYPECSAEQAEIPVGVVADAFYSKGTGLEALFRLVQGGVDAHLDSDREMRMSFPAGNPDWVPVTGSGSPEVIQSPDTKVLGCPECLRAFPLVAESLMPVVDCRYCGVPFHYAVA